MNILITGIHGFVGSNLVKALKANHTIYGLDIVAPQKEGVNQTYLWSELDKLPAVDVVIHLAGKAHDTKKWTNAQEYFDVNTTLAEKMYRWFLKSQASKFIFFSSVKAAADRVEGDKLTEDVIPAPKGPYGESKIAAERFILSRNTTESRHHAVETNHIKHQTKKYYILRPCMIHGPGNKGNLNLLYKVVKTGIPWPLGAFNNHRSFTSIDNLSYIIAELIEKEIKSGIYNIADDQSISTNELIAVMSETLNKPLRIWNFNAKLILLFTRIGTSLHLPLNEDRLQKLTENYVVSNAKIKKALGIQSLPVSAVEGLKKTINSLKS